METDAAEARAQLSEFDSAVDASTHQSIRMASWWAFPALALIGPALVLGLSSFTERAATPDQPLLTVFRVLAIVFAVIVVAAGIKEMRLERANPARPLAPALGGHVTKWLFALSFANVAGFMVPVNILTINDYEHPIRLAILAFLWSAIVPRYFHRRHVRAVRGQ